MNFTLVSCDADDWRGCPRDYYFDLDNILGFEVKDQSGDYLYGTYGLKIIEDIASGFDTLNVSNNGTSIYIGFIDNEDRGVVDQLITKRYYLIHQEGYKDTLDIDFKMRIDRCDDQVINYLKVVFNDSVYLDGNTDRVPFLRFIRN
ncbi:hypothetical protein D770_05090 [Flammeovirgaceae bacterium 311]|nr:hypothetical protein D770_05090 [Flammeovirgaceae bacterium 311]